MTKHPSTGNQLARRVVYLYSVILFCNEIMNLPHENSTMDVTMVA